MGGTLARTKVFVGFIEGTERGQANLSPACVDDHVAAEALVRVLEAFDKPAQLTAGNVVEATIVAQ